MEWVIGIGIAVVVILILAVVGQQRAGAEMEARLRQEKNLHQSGRWVKVRVVALTDRGSEAMWTAVGSDEEDAVDRAVDTINRLGRSGRVVEVIRREVIERSDGNGD